MSAKVDPQTGQRFSVFPTPRAPPEETGDQRREIKHPLAEEVLCVAVQMKDAVLLKLGGAFGAEVVLGHVTVDVFLIIYGSFVLLAFLT